MRDRFPKSVPVHNFRVPVKWDPTITTEHDGDTISCYGLYVWEAPKPQIVINSDLSYDLALDTFAHEVIHAWLHITGIIAGEHEEVVVRSLTPLLVQLLKEWKKNG